MGESSGSVDAMSPYAQSVFTTALIYSLVTMGLYVTLSSGQFSIAHATLMGIGGYAGGIASVQYHLSMVFSMIVGALVAGIFGGVMAILLRRTTGVLLGTVTIAIGQGISLTCQNLSYLGGSQGYTGISLTTNLSWAGGTALVGLAGILALRRSRFGIAMLAAGKDETVAQSIGISLLRVRVWGFVIGGFLAGLGGVLLAHNNGLIEPSDLSFASEPLFFIFLMVGGVETPWGAFFGALAMWWLQELLRFGNSQHFLFLDQTDRYWILGLILVVTVIVRPRGIFTRRHLRWHSSSVSEVATESINVDGIPG